MSAVLQQQAFSAKAVLPFKRLIEAGQLDESTAEVVLAAGALDPRVKGNPQKLVGFLAGYLFMQSQSVPVNDTLRMAHELGRTVNLSWTPRRWKEEHDRLSRAMTLKRLTGENVHYDLSTWLYLLPRFPGYLIRSSRRLGMEGLRQRHCVAAYHDRIMSGRRAILVVFLEGLRWTVEIALTNDPDRPLDLLQVKGRFNVNPTPDQRSRIHEILGIEERVSSPALSQAVPRYYLDNLQRILPVLRAHGVESVTVNFEGSGDSGSIEDIGFTPEIDHNDITVRVYQHWRHFDGDQWVSQNTEVDVPLETAISELTDDYLSETDVDWYNNDGGYGDLTINVEAGTVTLNINVRHVDSSCEFYRALDITTGDELE
jgi:hypothetical protein